MRCAWKTCACARRSRTRPVPPRWAAAPLRGYNLLRHIAVHQLVKRASKQIGHLHELIDFGGRLSSLPLGHRLAGNAQQHGQLLLRHVALLPKIQQVVSELHDSSFHVSHCTANTCFDGLILQLHGPQNHQLHVAKCGNQVQPVVAAPAQKRLGFSDALKPGGNKWRSKHLKPLAQRHTTALPQRPARPGMPSFMEYRQGNPPTPVCLPP